ncbi:MAG: hypothetical protein K6G44_00810 [Lentisphaeria bacterium]|nr:hypothetical protein [Lentisphaeria bacterium]
MCLAIEKMKEKGRREERRKSLKILEKEREKSLKALDEEREKLAKAIEKKREKLAKALEEEREKSLKALDEERKNGICNLIATCRDFGESLEKVCQRLMRSYHLTHSEATAYLKEYYV